MIRHRLHTGRYEYRPVPRSRRTGRQSHARCRRGAAAVEAAIVLPVFLLIILGTLDLGLAVFHDNMLSAIARRTARQAIVHGALAPPQMTAWGPSSYAGTANDASAVALAVRPMLITMDPSLVQINVDWLDGGNQPDQRVRVTLTYQEQSVVPKFFGHAPIGLQAVSTMRILH
jgi:Flp pilus assembly protein TadG